MIGPLPYTDSPFGKPDLTVHAVHRKWGQASLTECSSVKLQYEEGKSLALQTSVAGVQCNISTTPPPVCPTTRHTIIQCITTQWSTGCKVTVTPQVAPVRVSTGGQPQTTTGHSSDSPGSEVSKQGKSGGERERDALQILMQVP